MKVVDRQEEEIKRQAFNEGCDARLRGDNITSCPYTKRGHVNYWLAGWSDVNRFWGSKARWPIRPLPGVHRSCH